jgi:hypothetical protein
MVGTRMAYWVAQACRLTREDAGVHQTQVAACVGKRESSVYRFEVGNTWPRDADDYVNAYALTADLDDPRPIWDRALALWREHGANPFEETGSLSRFHAAIGAARGEGDPAAHGEPKQTKRADGRRPAANG